MNKLISVFLTKVLAKSLDFCYSMYSECCKNEKSDVQINRRDVFRLVSSEVFRVRCRYFSAIAETIAQLRLTHGFTVMGKLLDYIR